MTITNLHSSYVFAIYRQSCIPGIEHLGEWRMKVNAWYPDKPLYVVMGPQRTSLLTVQEFLDAQSLRVGLSR